MRKIPTWILFLKFVVRSNFLKNSRPWQDSNLQSPDPKSGALSIRPHSPSCVKRKKKLTQLCNGAKHVVTSTLSFWLFKHWRRPNCHSFSKWRWHRSERISEFSEKQSPKLVTKNLPTNSHQNWWQKILPTNPHQNWWKNFQKIGDTIYALEFSPNWVKVTKIREISLIENHTSYL